MPVIIVNKTCHDFLLDKHLSYKARGVLGYILSHQHGSEVQVEDLVNHSDEDGRLSVQSALQELIRWGYAKLELRRDKTGKVRGKQYAIANEPIYRQAGNLSVGTDEPKNQQSGFRSVGTDEPKNQQSGFRSVGGEENGVVADDNRQAGFLTVGKPACRSESSPSPLDSPFPEIQNPHTTLSSPTPSLSQPHRHGLDGCDVMAGSFSRQGQEDAQRVRDYLATKTGRPYPRPGQLILDRLGDGYSVDDLCLVIDWWSGVWIREHPTQASHFNTTTPFRQEKFGDYWAAAQQWRTQQRPGSAGTKRKQVVL